MELAIADVEARVDDHVERYRETAPFHPVEAESIETLPAAFRAGDYGRRDVEWVVRWYFRRRVDAIDHEERRAVEEAVEDADPSELRGAMWDAIDALADLPSVDLAVASALLWFLDPDRFLVVGDREWRVVAALTDLDPAYPEPMTPAAYDRYLDSVRTLADRLDVDHWRLYMVIQRVYAEEFDGEGNGGGDGGADGGGEGNGDSGADGGRDGDGNGGRDGDG